MHVNKGSEWRKWDLHFHTPSSYDYKDGDVTNQQIIDELALKKISVVAITDHHEIDIERITELQKLGADKNVTVLPGIEFLSDAKGSEPIHFIGIFAENSNIKHIWGQIQNRTEISKIIGEGKKHNEIYCHLLDTIAIVKDLGGIVTIHAGSKTNGIENITHALPHSAAQKEDIAEAVDIFEMGKETDVADYQKIVIPFLKKKINKNLPLILCTDNHKISDYIIKQNLWVKANPNFEGLKQIIYEPDHRVRVQLEEPDYKEDKLIIDEVKFISSNNRFSPEVIHLNKNLNVIIGGKSSGKSILLYNIAKTLFVDKEFFQKENIEEKYNFRADDPHFNFEIKTKGGFSQLMIRDPSENSIIPEIKYIPQNYLVKLAEPEQNKKGAALNKIVRDLINEDSDSKNYYDSFITLVKQNDKKRESIIDNYFDLKSKIKALEDELKLKSKKEILETNIRTNTEKVEDLNKSAGLSPEQIEEYNILQGQMETNKSKRAMLSNDYKKINDFNNEAYETLNSLNRKKELLSNSLENQQFKETFDEKYSGLSKLISEIESFRLMFALARKEDGSTYFVNGGLIASAFNQNSVEKKDIESKLQPFLKNQEIKAQIDIINKSITDDKNSLHSIEQLSKEIDDTRNALNHERQTLLDLYLSNHKAYLDVISELKSRTVELEKDALKINGLVKFNFPKFRKALLAISDGRKASYAQYKICEELDSLSEYQLSELLDELLKIFNSIVESETYALTSKTERKHAIKTLFDDYFFDYWEIEYKNDKLGEMSTGKASFVILMLIVGLSKSKSPILIDQPEDNLDNRSITTDLVEYLRNKKLERQIILVTHNPNVVVNADAENIIVANQKGQNETETSSPYQFDYINGALENSFVANDSEKDLLKKMGIREHIADIVEGGKEAFKKREEKYGF